MDLTTSIKEFAWRIKRDVMTVYFAARDSNTPMAVRVLALAVAAYALSPVDLIPDFIPVLGYLDDLVLVPLGILLIIKLLPPEVLATSRTKAEAVATRPNSILAAALIIGMWVLCALAFAYWLLGVLGT
jgi:uncharacterized membrane protein YkvA (DUF1232 family)